MVKFPALDLLSQDHAEAALGLVKAAATFAALDNDGKREWAVAELVKQTNLPESLARLLVEVVVQIVKSQVKK